MAANLDIIIKVIDQASKEADKIATSISGIGEAGKKMMKVGGALSLGVTAPLAAAGAMAVSAASDMDESLSKVGVVFDENAAQIEAWSETASTALGLSQEQALSAAGTFGNLFTSMGIGADDTAAMSTGLVDLAADLASFNNIDPTIALEKLRAGMLGQAEPMQALGVSLTAAAVEAQAAAMGLGAMGEELSEQDKMAARYAIIMQQTATAQGDFARTSEGLANQQRIIKAQFADVSAELGAVLLPMAVQVAGVISEVAAAFSNLSPEMQQLIVYAGLAAAAIGPIVTVVGALTTALGLILSPIGLVVAAIVGLVAIVFDLGGAGSAVADMFERWGLEGVANGIRTVNVGAKNLVETLGKLITGEMTFGDITMPQWIDDLMFWKWPELGIPDWIETLFNWAWPLLGPVGWVIKLMAWGWPKLDKPSWLNSLLDFEWPGMPSLPGFLGGDGGETAVSGGGLFGRGNQATGTGFFRGGGTWVGETGPEWVRLPRGSAIMPAGAASQMAAAGAGGATININATVLNEMDAHVMARQVADILRRGG